jgi:hypothetical protein
VQHFAQGRVHSNDANHKERLEEFYSQNCPGENVSKKVEDLLREYRGKEGLLFARLYIKYTKTYYVRLDGQAEYIETKGKDFELIWEPQRVHAELTLALRDGRVVSSFRAFNEDIALPVEEVTIGADCSVGPAPPNAKNAGSAAMTVRYGEDRSEQFYLAFDPGSATVNMQVWTNFLREASLYAKFQDKQILQWEEGAVSTGAAYLAGKRGQRRSRGVRGGLKRLGNLIGLTDRHALPDSVLERLDQQEERSNELMVIEEPEEEQAERLRDGGGSGGGGADDDSSGGRLGLSRKQLEQIEKAEPGDYQVQVHIIEARNLVGRDLQGTSNPIAYVTVGNSKQLSTQPQRASASCVFDELLFFELENMNASSLQRAQVTIKVCNHNKLTSDKLLGEYVMDLASAYVYQPQRQWAVLINPGGRRSDNGEQGFLQLSITVRGPADNVAADSGASTVIGARPERRDTAGPGASDQHGPAEKDRSRGRTPFWKGGWTHSSASAAKVGQGPGGGSRGGGGSSKSNSSGGPNADSSAGVVAPGLARLMIPAQIKQELWFLRVGVHRGEDLPNMDWVMGTNRGAGIDAYVIVKFAGNKPVKTKVKKSLNPRFNEEFWIPVLLPMCGQRIEIEVWDHDSLSPHDLVGTISASFEDVRRGQKGWGQLRQGSDDDATVAGRLSNLSNAHAHPCLSPSACTAGAHWYNIYGAQSVNTLAMGFGFGEEHKRKVRMLEDGHARVGCY